VIGWVVAASCCHCGGELERVTEGRPVGNECSAIGRCSLCGREHHVRVELVDLVALRRQAPGRVA
jgi:hypothetical protein